MCSSVMVSLWSAAFSVLDSSLCSNKLWLGREICAAIFNGRERVSYGSCLSRSKVTTVLVGSTPPLRLQASREPVERVRLSSRVCGCAFSPTQTSRARLEVVTFLPCSSTVGELYARRVQCRIARVRILHMLD